MTQIPAISQWDKCLLEDRSQCLPSRPGLYAVLDRRGHAHYVGKSINLKSRWAGYSHHRCEQAERELNDPRLAWVVLPKGAIHDLETQLIRYYKARGQANWNNTTVPDYTPIPFWQRLLNLPLWGWGAIAVGALLLFSDEPQTELVNVYDDSGQLVYRLPSYANVTTGECRDGFVWAVSGSVRGWVDVVEVDDDVCL